jgi:preprotein translocase subunit SecY
MAALQSLSQIGLVSTIGNKPVFENFGWNLNSFAIVLTMTAGTMFAIWLGELISEFGIRNQGLSLIIFAGIVSRIPSNFANMFSDEQTRWQSLGVYGFLIVAVIFLIVIHAGPGEPAPHGQHGGNDPPDFRRGVHLHTKHYRWLGSAACTGYDQLV